MSILAIVNEKGEMTLIVKPFTSSPFILGLQALIMRLHPTHPQFERLQKELKIKEAGDFGERYIMQELQKFSTLYDFHVLHNVILPTVLPMQIDILVITPNGVILLEIKNIRGQVRFKNNPRQLIRTTEKGDTAVFTHPEVQLEQYILAMQQFFDAHHISMPIYGAIVFPFNNVTIHREGEGLPILMAKELPLYFHKLSVGRYQQSVNDITHMILSHIRDRAPFPLCEYYDIEVANLQKGIYCENCGQYGMQKLKRGWICTRCQYVCPHAHVRALRDYYMLVGDTITNKDCRYFLNIDSQDVAKRILQKSCVTRSGSGKYTQYNLSGLYRKCEDSRWPPKNR